MCGGSDCKEHIQKDGYLLIMHDHELRAGINNIYCRLGGHAGAFVNDTLWHDLYARKQLEYVNANTSSKSQEYAQNLQKWFRAKPCTEHQKKRRYIQDRISSAKHSRNRLNLEMARLCSKGGDSIMDVNKAYYVDVFGSSAYMERIHHESLISDLQESINRETELIEHLKKELHNLGHEHSSPKKRKHREIES